MVVQLCLQTDVYASAEITQSKKTYMEVEEWGGLKRE